MDKINLGICLLDDDGNVLAKKVVSANWSVDINDAKEMFKQFKVSMADEVSDVLVESLKMKISSNDIKELLSDIGVCNE